MPGRLDRAALRAGGMVALVFAVPFSAAATFVASGKDGTSAAATWLSLAAVAGFVLGAGVAAWVQQRQLPLMHGLVCAIGTYVIAQTIFIIARLVTGREVRWFAAIFNLTAVAVAGLIGGGLGSALQKRGFTPSANGSAARTRPGGTST